MTGPVGQIDYVAANEYLNAYATSRAGEKTRVVALNWGVWDEVGMAVEGAERTARRPPPRPGRGARPCRCGPSGPSTPRGAACWAPPTTSPSAGSSTATAPGRATRLIPGTGYVEMAAQALAAQGEGMRFEIRDLIFLRPLAVEDDAPRDVRARLRAHDRRLFLRGPGRLRGRRTRGLRHQCPREPVAATDAHAPARGSGHDAGALRHARDRRARATASPPRRRRI